MAWALALGGAAFINGMIQGNEARSAANAANSQREKIAEQQYKRAKKEYEIDWANTQVAHAWELAKTEAFRFQERQKKATYEQRMGWLVDGAMKNLRINSKALYDKYVTQETLRARQEIIGLDDTLSELTGDQKADLEEVLNQSGQLAGEALQAGLDTSERVAGYMRSVQQRALEAAALADDVNNKSAALQEEIVLDAATDAIKRDIEMVTAIEESSGRLASMSARQGNSSTAVRAAKNQLQAMGRSYGLLNVNQQQRTRRLAAFNGQFGQRAQEMAQLGNQMQAAVDQIKYTNKKYQAAAPQMALKQLALQNRAASIGTDFARESNTTLDRFTDLKIPGFQQARRQGKRELKALIQSTQKQLNEAAVPYLDAVIIDPLKPIKGLKPEYYAPTKQHVPSWGGIVAGSVMQGVNAAMNMSYTDGDGNLQFH